MKKLFFFIAILPATLFSQHSVNGTFSPVEAFTYAFLYHSSPTGSDYVNRAKLEADGSFKIELDSTATAGIYKIVYALPPEENNFDFIYDGKENVHLIFNLENGLEFTASNENKLWSSYTKSMGLVNRTISNFYTKESTDKNAFKEIFKTLKDTQNAYEEASKGTLANVFITSNKPYVPTEFEDISTYSKNLKRTYLLNVDFNNELLQSSDFLIERILAYLFGMSATTTNATYKEDIDTLVKEIEENNTAVKISLLELIWERFTQQDNETVANYIADVYLLDLAKQINHAPLIEALSVYKNNAMGKLATNFDIALTKDGETITTSLHDLDRAEDYLIIFWSSSCGHCLEELPEVSTMIAKKPNLKVIAIGLEDDAEHWQKMITTFPDFTHVLGLGKWENPIAIAYGVKATPSYFMLDKDKKIVAKPYDLEALKKVLE
jgi:thiol-disulfide isomerase/thioredoxin